MASATTIGTAAIERDPHAGRNRPSGRAVNDVLRRRCECATYP